MPRPAETGRSMASLSDFSTFRPNIHQFASFPLNLCRTSLVDMSGRLLYPSAALLRSLRSSPSLRQCPRQFPIGGKRPLHTSPKSLEEEGQKSFRGQLYESTARRIQRQREAEARFASMTPPSAFARNAAFTFCPGTFPIERTTADVRQQLYSHVD